MKSSNQSVLVYQYYQPSVGNHPVIEATDQAWQV